ncbi:MAG: hypothetical protein PHG80_10460 [Methanoregulaceae archaeon]|nr:hypothetical protein [Methanoregulaceae archaeon]
MNSYSSSDALGPEDGGLPSRTEALGPSIYFSSTHFCSVLGREIDYDLVRVVRPDCIEQMNGCGNCPNRRYVTIRKVSE